MPHHNLFRVSTRIRTVKANANLTVALTRLSFKSARRHRYHPSGAAGQGRLTREWTKISGARRYRTSTNGRTRQSTHIHLTSTRRTPSTSRLEGHLSTWAARKPVQTSNQPWTNRRRTTGIKANRSMSRPTSPSMEPAFRNAPIGKAVRKFIETRAVRLSLPWSASLRCRRFNRSPSSRFFRKACIGMQWEVSSRLTQVTLCTSSFSCRTKILPDWHSRPITFTMRNQRCIQIQQRRTKINKIV